MRHAHPRTPGGRSFVPKNNAMPPGKSKFVPPPSKKLLIAPPKKADGSGKAEG
ncbi:MAG TPA: hypothetical protein VG733_09620 [Chthoniobacteraceae bacterium]|nr:hypothetical protein [Chthoniobacteraceae bacterium]